MKKIILALVVGLAVCSIPSAVEARPPGFYNRGYYANPYSPYPSVGGYNYYSSPYGYRTYNTYGAGFTPYGPYSYNYGGTYVRPYVNAPYHSVYWDPFNNTYQYGTGYLNSPSFYQYYGFGY